MVRLVVFVVGFLIFLWGVFAFLMPIIPLGFVFIGIGLAMMLKAKPGLRLRVQRMRAKNPGFDRRMRAAEDRLPEWMSHQLRRTRPGEDAGADGADG